MTRATTLSRYAAASVGVMALASANGALRDLTYGRLLPERAAHLLSLLPALAAFATYSGHLERRRPLPSGRAAVEVGLLWAAIGLAFEVGLGRARGMSWRELGRHYDPAAGGTGLLVLAGAAASPVAAHRVLAGCGCERSCA